MAMSFMAMIYRIIIVMVLSLTVRCCFREKNFWRQATAALVVIPLLLRLLMLK